ncbi:uncharacterized protein LOC141718831 [Apium graveolens]|uniref:uncharacterized protein LOC141718831 n=1 Tax=Apium graveolens TaxID=4045 RepID=UPI003D78F5B3
MDASKSQIFIEIEKDTDVCWPKPLKVNPAKLDTSKYYRFHKDVVHDTDEFRQLKDGIEILIRKGILSKYTGDREKHNSGRRNFDDRKGSSKVIDDFDSEGVKFPHDDPLVITPVENSPVKRVIVDNGASIDILLYDTFIMMGYNDSQLNPTDTPIYGFAGVECPVEGIIKLPLTMGQEPRRAMQMLNFMVVKAGSTYIAIMGRKGSGKFLGLMIFKRGIEANPDKKKAILDMEPPRKRFERCVGEGRA